MVRADRSRSGWRFKSCTIGDFLKVSRKAPNWRGSVRRFVLRDDIVTVGRPFLRIFLWPRNSPVGNFMLCLGCANSSITSSASRVFRASWVDEAIKWRCLPQRGEIDHSIQAHLAMGIGKNCSGRSVSIASARAIAMNCRPTVYSPAGTLRPTLSPFQAAPAAPNGRHRPAGESPPCGCTRSSACSRRRPGIGTSPSRSCPR